MKILKKKRGFTTNSSSSNEWLTPTATPTNHPLNAQPALHGNIVTAGIFIACILLLFFIQIVFMRFKKRKNKT